MIWAGTGGAAISRAVKARREAWQGGKKYPAFPVASWVLSVGAQGGARADVRAFAERLWPKPSDWARPPRGNVAKKRFKPRALENESVGRWS